MLQDLQHIQDGPIVLYCDNQSTIQMSKNPLFHDKTKHIDIQHHYIRDFVQESLVELVYCSTTTQFADIFAKPFVGDHF